jgi:hypothetical protein
MTTVRQVMAEIVDLPKPAAEAPGPFRYGDADKLLTLPNRAGYGELDVGDWRGELPIGGKLPAAEAAIFALVSFSSFGETLAEAGKEALDESRRSLAARLCLHQKEDAVWRDSCFHIFTGARVECSG